jgi:hypothetical protein
MKIAVIGAGIFGLETASQLSTNGNVVSIFERNSDILSEATSNSIMRLHLGLHYPRDLETAIQSLNGYKLFVQKFSECVNLSFPNYYAISNELSKINETHFAEFIIKSGIEVQPIPIQNLAILGAATNKISSAWVCKEGVIDMVKIRKHYKNELVSNKNLYLNTEIIGMEKIDNIWQLTDYKGNKYDFDFIVRATYGLDRISSTSVNLQNREFEFHKTLILEVEIDKPQFGLTVIDGDFITILPKGFGGTFLLYGPKPSVLERFIGNSYPSEWDRDGYFDYESGQEMLLERFNTWFPGIAKVKVINRFHTVRSIQPNVSKTDQRVSRVELKSDGFIDIWSGKIDHCIQIGTQVVEMVNQ